MKKTLLIIFISAFSLCCCAQKPVKHITANETDTAAKIYDGNIVAAYQLKNSPALVIIDSMATIRALINQVNAIQNYLQPYNAAVDLISTIAIDGCAADKEKYNKALMNYLAIKQKQK